MVRNDSMSARTRAYPRGDAQVQHPAPARNGQGLLHQGRVQRKKRVREVRMISWNVGTMTGRGRELAEIMDRRRVRVACLQETKWKGTKAREIGLGYKFFYSGGDGKSNGVGVVLDKDLKECVTEVKRVNDRIILVRVMLEDVVLNIMSVYAPQIGCDDAVKDKFYEDFDTTVMCIPQRENLYIGGDFNGHVGRANAQYERIHGGWGYGDCNKEGEALLQAATAFDLAITNTFFQKQVSHLITYNSGGYSTQVDYWLLRRDKLKTVKDCKVIPGEPLVSQHRLVLIELKIAVSTSKYKPKAPPKTKWFMLEKKEIAVEFKERIVDKITSIERDLHTKPANECWNEMAEHMRNVGREVCGETTGKCKIDRETWWWSEEIQKCIKDKKKAFKEWKECDPSVRDARRNEYIECKKKAKKAVAIARGKEQDKLYKSLESPQGQKHLYRLAKAREKNAKDIAHVKCIKDERGNVLINGEDIRTRWKGYFNRLMNEENNWSGILEDRPLNVGMVNKVSIDEVRIACQSMANGKSVGPDNIPVEAWKVLKVDGWKWLTLFFNKLLQEESIPDEWCNSTLVPIYKNKGDVQDCNNYRGIKLMSHTMKIWEKVIARRMREESEVTQNQFGFMPGRGTTDAIFALRQLCEKYRRAHKNLHMVFIDLEKAYDRVPRKVLWWAMKEKRVPEKYVRIVKGMYERASTNVRSEAGLTDQFSVAVGLHQGSALSPYLFLLVIDALTSDIQEEAPWCMLFADDIVLVGEDATEVQNTLGIWQQRLETVGLKISRSKTEQLFCDFGGSSNFSSIAIDGIPLPVCSDFRYLGSLFQSDGEIDRDVKNRMNAGWMKWRQVSGTTCDPRMPYKLKGKVYKTVIRPVVMYGSECWAMKKKDEQRLHVTEMRMLRWMSGVTKMDKIRNEYIRGSLKVAPINEKIRSARLRWYGHVMRRDEHHITRRVMDMRVNGNFGRGRPKKSWMECVKNDMKVKGVNASMTSDRSIWKEKTYCADPT